MSSGDATDLGSDKKGQTASGVVKYDEIYSAPELRPLQKLWERWKDQRQGENLTCQMTAQGQGTTLVNVPPPQHDCPWL